MLLGRPSPSPSPGHAMATKTIQVKPPRPVASTVDGFSATGNMNNHEPLHFACDDAVAHTCARQDLVLGTKLSCLAYIDDEPGSIEKLAGTKKAIESIAGGVEQARVPVTRLLSDMGYHVDRLFSHTGMLGDGDANDTQGFIAHNDQDVVLSYRGTVSLLDCVTDLTASHVLFAPSEDHRVGHAIHRFPCCRPPSGPNMGRVHRGFYDAFLSSIADIEDVLIPQLNTLTPRRLIITGHSLGGALATGALAYLLQRLDFLSLPHTVLFVTLGQPRFGDAQFRKFLLDEISRLQDKDKFSSARMVHDHDGVPMVPPTWMSYEHVMDTLLLTEAGKLLLCPRVKNSRVRHWKEYLDDHNPHLYLHLLTSFTDETKSADGAEQE